MHSVADSLRAETLAADALLTPAERVANALRQGDADVRAFAQARGLSEYEARRQLARLRQYGRLRSACHESLLA